MTAYAGNIIYATDVNNVGTVLKRSERTTNGTTTTTTPQGYMRLDSIDIVSGNCYEVKTSPLIFESSVAGDLVTITLYGSTSGAATTSSTQLTALVDTSQTASGNQKTKGFSYLYAAATTGQLSLLIAYVRTSGTGNVRINASATLPAQLWVTVGGVDPGDTGVDI